VSAKPCADWPVLTFSFEAKRLALNIMFKGNTKNTTNQTENEGTWIN
jgi:hypothetical protein